jgi:hypothetical protein
VRGGVPRRQALAKARVARGASTTTTLPVMPGTFIHLSVNAPIVGVAIALAGVLFGLWINGDRTERQRKRDLHARALAAILAYGEMPFMIRRRRFEESERSAERVRLSDHFSTVKAEINTCQVLLAADGDEKLAAAYDALVQEARQTAGQEAHTAWTEPPVTSDAEMNMGGLFEKLTPFRTQLDAFKDDLARSTLPRRQRLQRKLHRVSH